MSIIVFLEDATLTVDVDGDDEEIKVVKDQIETGVVVTEGPNDTVTIEFSDGARATNVSTEIFDYIEDGDDEEDDF